MLQEIADRVFVELDYEGANVGCILTDEGAVVNSCGEKRTLKADTVVLALGLKSEGALTKGLQGKVPELYAIGDCVEPRRIINAVWEAYRIARLI